MLAQCRYQKAWTALLCFRPRRPPRRNGWPRCRTRRNTKRVCALGRSNMASRLRRRVATLEMETMAKKSRSQDAPGGLSGKQAVFLQALMTCQTVKQAFEQAGVGNTTAYRWLHDPVFSAVYHQACTDVVRHAIRMVQSKAAQAFEVLSGLMLDEDRDPALRLKAAMYTLDMAHKALMAELYEERLTKLEAQLLKTGSSATIAPGYVLTPIARAGTP